MYTETRLLQEVGFLQVAYEIYEIYKRSHYLLICIYATFNGFSGKAIASGDNAIALSPPEFWINLDGNIVISDRISNS